MVKRDAGGKKDKLLCCKRIFDRIKANLAEIQLKRHQNVQKIPGVNGLRENILTLSGSEKEEVHIEYPSRTIC